MSAHRCDDECVCPLDGKPLLYAPASDQHACQDPDCTNAQGIPDVVQQYLERRFLSFMDSAGIEEPGPRMAAPRKLTGRTITTSGRLTRRDPGSPA